MICQVEASKSIPGKRNRMSKGLIKNWSLLTCKVLRLGWGCKWWWHSREFTIEWMKRCGLLMARHNSLTFKGTCYRCSSFLGTDPMRSKASERKTTSVSHFWLVELVEGEEKLNPSGPFFLPVAHPRPRGQVIASGFVEKVMLGGLPGLNARIVEKMSSH